MYSGKELVGHSFGANRQRHSMHGVYWVNIENALRWEELSFVIRRRAVYVAAARPHQCTTYIAYAER
jgi:hypothetical protein